MDSGNSISSMSGGESRFSSPRRTERQKKKDMLLNRRAVAGGGAAGGGLDLGNATNGDIYDPNGSKSKLLRKKRVGTKGKAKKKSRSQGGFGASTLAMLIIVGLVIAGTLVVSYIFIGKNPAAAQLAGENGSIVSVHNLLRRKFTGGDGGEGSGGTQAYNEQPVPHQDAANSNANRFALEEEETGGGVMRYDLNKLQLDYEKATSQMPEFPQEYLGEIPVKDYDIERDYFPKGGNRFEEYNDGNEPYHITRDLIQKSNELARARRPFVKAAMKHAWSGYEKYGFGMDEVLPQTHVGDNNWGGMGITMVDALDTLWLMGMKEEFYKGRDWVRDSLNHDRVGTVSVFETTIRSLGGLLSAYDWSHDQAFLDQAYDLGKRLIRSFDGSSTGIPFGQVDLRSGRSSNIGWTGNNAILSEFGTLQIEYRYLAKAMRGEKSTDVFARKTEHVFEILDDISPSNGLFPYYLNNNPHGNDKKRPTKHHKHHPLNNKNGEADREEKLESNEQLPQFANNHLTFGAMADSLYEYMLKIWLQGGQTEPMYREMYDKAIQGMHDELLQTSSPSGLVYIADKQGSTVQHKMDHLVCFMGGLLALGAYTDPQGLHSERAQRDLKSGRALTYTCYQMYARMATGISPEYVEFTPNDHNRDFRIGNGAPHYLLRPEAVESFFILNFLTNDPVYREWGWEVFQSIEKYCKTDIAYGSLGNVDAPPDSRQKPRNKMESFFLAETLKYLYLLQDPDTEVDILNKHVFNTEAHPMKIFPAFDAQPQ